MLGLYFRQGGCLCEMGISWHLLRGRAVPQLEVFSEAWHLLKTPTFRAVLDQLTKEKESLATPAEVIGQICWLDEIIVDSFAGGGGASTGIELAAGRIVDVAINHDPDAILIKQCCLFSIQHSRLEWESNGEGNPYLFNSYCVLGTMRSLSLLVHLVFTTTSEIVLFLFYRSER